MTKARFFETAATAGLMGAALATPAAAHHDSDCERWRGAPLVDHGGIRVEARTIRWLDRCRMAPGTAVELPDGTRYQVIVSAGGVDVTRQADGPPPAAPAAAEGSADSKKAKPRCKKKQRKNRSKRSARSCRR